MNAAAVVSPSRFRPASTVLSGRSDEPVRYTVAESSDSLDALV